MLKSKSIGLLILLSVSLIFTVSALSVQKTEFVISTDPYENLSISVINPDSKEEIQVFAGKARKFGEFRFTYYGTIPKVKLIASIINNETGEAIKKEELGPFNLGTPLINLNFSRSKEEAKTEENKANSPQKTESETSQEGQNNPVTGAVIGSEKSFSIIYYFVAAGALGVIVLLIVLIKKKKFIFKSSPQEPNPAKLVKAEKDKKPAKAEVKVQPSTSSAPLTVADTEKRIAELQNQLDQIKNEEKLFKLQQQVDQEKKSLDKLRGRN